MKDRRNRRFRRMFLIALAFSMMFSMTACGKDKKDKAKKDRPELVPYYGTEDTSESSVSENESDIITDSENNQAQTDSNKQADSDKDSVTDTAESDITDPADTSESVSGDETDSDKETADKEAGSKEDKSAAEKEIKTYTEDGVTLSNDSSDFVLLTEVVPNAILEIRYYSTYNFVGERIDGYEEPTALLTREAANALKEVSDDLEQKGYRLKIYDAYRPQEAVTNFVNWAADTNDTKMKEYFYPNLDKSVLFSQGYIAKHSGHSRGSTLDLTLFDMKTEKEVDMGGTFDFFGELSHSDYRGVTDEQYANRMLLREAMTSHGFKPYSEEWWHFTLSNEPYPNTYFTFPVNSESVE